MIRRWLPFAFVLACFAITLHGQAIQKATETIQKTTAAEGSQQSREVTSAQKAIEDKLIGDETRSKKDREDYYKLLLIFADTIDQIDRNYVEKVSRRELLEAAIEGALKKLDPYSNYIAPDEMDEFKIEVENEFGGIGIQISTNNGQLRVISPLVGTPAYRAGVQSDDLIMSIDGTSTKDMKIDDAIKLMKGRAGTDVLLTLFHPLSGSTEDVRLTREVIKVQTILGDRRKPDDAWQFMYDPLSKIGYIRLTTFGRETADDLRDALESLQKEAVKGLILDLRYNPGGLLKSAIEVADTFLAEGTIVSTKGRNIKRQVWEAEQDNTFQGFPMVVLVNQYSASASEIVAAALQDHGRAKVIGQQTFGKASVQNVVELEDGKSALKITTGSYQRPSGKPIHRFPEAKEWGVRPDDGYDVVLSMTELDRLMRQRRRRDIVGESVTEPNFQDRQMDRALGYLRGEIGKLGQ